MTTLPQLPESDSRPPQRRAAALWLIPVAVLGIVTALLLQPLLWPDTAPPEPDQPQPTLTQENAGELCRSLEVDPKEYVGDTVLRRRWELRRQSCNMAFADHPDDLYFKVQTARWMPYEQKEEAIRLWREAAAQGSAEAYHQIYQHHRSWDRGDLGKVQLVTRAEAAEALRKAAEL